MESTVAFSELTAGSRMNTKVGVMKPSHKLRTGLVTSVAVEAEKARLTMSHNQHIFPMCTI